MTAHTRANRHDPTRTTHLRNQFSREMRKRFRALRGMIRKAIIDQDVFGLQANVLPGRREFFFARSGEKVGAFMAWLEEAAQQNILEVTDIQRVGESVDAAWSNKYIKDSYQRGVIRANQEMRSVGYNVPSIDRQGGIEAVMNGPIHVDAVGGLYTRTFSDLKGITQNMDAQISRVLSRGMADGDNPRLLAKKLTRTISGPVGDLGLTDTLGRFIPAERRSQMLARTETIRAHHIATIKEYKNWEVEGVRVRAEWQTAGDDRVCEECEEMEGETFDLDKAENLLPRHPHCRCIALPVIVKQ